MAVCDNCGREMLGSVGCTLTTYQYTRGVYERIAHAADAGTCHDCLAPAGMLHHPGCDAERCPRCLGQSIGCACV